MLSLMMPLPALGSRATIQKFWITLYIGHQVKNLLGRVWEQCASLYNIHIVSLPNHVGER